jgi:phosphatidylserine decarboxylase
MFTVRALREGAGPILILVLLTLGTGLVAWWFGAILGVVLLFAIAFFRDPDRPVPADPEAVLSPADGTVVDVTRQTEARFLGGESLRVAIFLSVFDVHVQRMPVSGGIRMVDYHPGRHLDARDGRATAMNESRFVGIEAEDGYRVAVRQIAGKVARRIVGWAGPGARLARGERLGMIRFGSRVEIFLPPDAQVLVTPGQHVKGGETILARRRTA